MTLTLEGSDVTTIENICNFYNRLFIITLFKLRTVKSNSDHVSGTFFVKEICQTLYITNSFKLS